MRKHHQNQILTLLEQIKGVQADGLYAECQEAALFLCDFVEDVAGEDTETVRLLIEYCELLFKAHGGEANKKILDKQLVKIENKVKSELVPTKIEMAFISHKAAQSDAIETIYLAAKQDPDCDAFWIPVPYDVYHPDGSVRGTVLESIGFYDERFEITDYREYDIKARRPDAIFTFNPYNSDWKFVGVHPDYYPENLRLCTDMLVYSPYYISGDNKWLIGRGEKERLSAYSKYIDSGMFEPLVNLGSIHAHKVVLQSEPIKWLYQQMFLKELDTKPSKTDKKFVAIGSPKIDKVLGSKKEDFSMPQEWLDIIGDRKIILYNSTIAGFSAEGVNTDGRYLAKLTTILTTFAYRNDVVLWWRPHPFMLEHTERYLPKHTQLYKALVEGYKNKKFGIYDDTHDLHRAFAWSDAYYGDGGSLLPLYAFTGKPAMRSNKDIKGFEGAIGEDRAEEIKKGGFGGELVVKTLFGSAEVESEEFGLSDFISFAASPYNTAEDVQARKEAYQEVYAPHGDRAGEMIYQYIMDEVKKDWGGP